MDRIRAKEGSDRAIHPHSHLAGRMAGQRLPAIARVRVHNRRPPVPPAPPPGWAIRCPRKRQLHGSAAGPAALVLPVFQFASADQIARVGEGRNPAAVEQARIPADVIDVQSGCRTRGRPTPAGHRPARDVRGTRYGGGDESPEAGAAPCPHRHRYRPGSFGPLNGAQRPGWRGSASRVQDPHGRAEERACGLDLS